MTRNITLIIADDEPLICGMLEKLIDFDGLGLKLLGCVHNGELLKEEICAKKPDVVLTDISMPKKDGLQVIREIREKGIDCRFIIISGYRQFEYAYNALKYNVEDYLLKPVDKGELNRALRKICDEIRNLDSESTPSEMVKLHRDFLERGVHEDLKQRTTSLETLNESYETSFKTGCFRFAMLKLGFLREPNQETDDVTSLIQKLENLLSEIVTPHCFETINTNFYDGIMFLMNYEKAQEKEIKNSLISLFESSRQFVDMFEGINLTLCVGKEIRDVNLMEEAKISCRRAIWMRMHYGINRILYEESEPDISDPDCQNRLDQIHLEMSNSITTINEEKISNAIRTFFAQPKSVLCSTVCMQFMRDEIRLFVDRYTKLIKKPVEGKDVLQTITTRIYRESDFKGYENRLIEIISIYMKKLAAIVNEKKAKPVLMATAYIEQHFAEQLTLETMAQYVSLSPIYFSNLFKKETGHNFSDFLTEYRIKKAKEMLREGDRNINEIADALGYSDSRYFSKVFKKVTGVKPTDYRRLYN